MTPQDILYQAEGFLQFASRGEDSLRRMFAFWLRSKDFDPRDRHAIADEIRKILAQEKMRP